MDGNRVGTLIDSLTSTYEAAFNFYTRWKQKQEEENHYQRRAKKRSPAISKCSVGVSLDISSHRIRSTYQVGFAIIGPEFYVGDAICRDCLWASLTQLHERVNLLRLAILSAHRAPLDLHELMQVSEATRHSCVNALAGQYKRLSTGRPLVPPDLPVPSLRPPPSLPLAQREREQQPYDHPSKPLFVPHNQLPPVDFDHQTAIWSEPSTPGPPVFQSEPPSPPPTPQPGDTPSLVGGLTPSVIGAASSTNPRLARRPNNSVFSIFCPEALALQVDPARPVPDTWKCRCGYRWNFDDGGLREEDGNGSGRPVVVLKEGFRMTKRFLAKSHCDQGKDDGSGERDRAGGGYGCVLCIGSGRAETFESVEVLGRHVNAVHTKWQMLHDRDMS